MTMAVSSRFCRIYGILFTGFKNTDAKIITRTVSSTNSGLQTRPKKSDINFTTRHRSTCLRVASAGKNRSCLSCSRCQKMSQYTAPGVDYIFRQMFENKSSTYTYLLADSESKEAVLIDPVLETVDRDVKLVQNLGLNLVYAVNTHVHADHITGTGGIKNLIPTCKSMIAEISKAQADVKLKEGDFIKFGKFKLEVRSTPGHTNGCLTYVWREKNMAFTGDALLIGGCGRTDFQEGDPGKLYDSVHGQILALPEYFQLYPAHDYTGRTVTTVGEENKYNPRLTKTKSQFVEIMNTLNLPYPKQIDKALPANMVCGVFEVPESK